MFFSFSQTWHWGAFLWAWNGVGLAFVIPNTQSLVADFYDDHSRGRAFGTLYTTGARHCIPRDMSQICVLPVITVRLGDCIAEVCNIVNLKSDNCKQCQEAHNRVTSSPQV